MKLTSQSEKTKRSFALPALEFLATLAEHLRKVQKPKVLKKLNEEGEIMIIEKKVKTSSIIKKIAKKRYIVTIQKNKLDGNLFNVSITSENGKSFCARNGFSLKNTLEECLESFVKEIERKTQND